MDIKKTNRNANNIMWVEYWIRKAHPSFAEYVLDAEKYDDKRWICEIELPLIEKTVKSISEKEVNAMLNASDKAAKLIDEYMKEHPELIIKNTFKGKRWEIVSDETGRYLSMGMSSAWRREIGKQMEKQMNGSIAAIKKAVKKLVKINGTSKNLFIQVLDTSLFDKNMSEEDILEEMNDRIAKEYHIALSTVSYDRNGDSVIAYGYVLQSEQQSLDWSNKVANA